ncbi:MAG: ABC-2 transporter permease [Methanobrevibacter sp.]|jgi:hypothetical protein|nr:ABC-2 transporter permease [Candidatus Methanovirga procula]
MNFNNIKKICLKELKESMANNNFKRIYFILLIFIPLFNFMNKDFSLAVFLLASFFIILVFVSNKFYNEILLGRFSQLLALPMSLKEIFLGKYLSIGILVSFYFIWNIFVSILIFFIDNTINIDLIVISILFLPIIFLYFSIDSLLYLKYKNRLIREIFNMIPLIIFIFTFSSNKIDIAFVLNSIKYVQTKIIPIEIAIIVVLLPVMIFLLNRLNKEKILLK